MALETDIAIRVIVDHIRAVAHLPLLMDKYFTSNNVAGYVIRRNFKTYDKDGLLSSSKREAFINELVKEVLESDQLRKTFPNWPIKRRIDYQMDQEEEISFLKTLGQGLGLLDDLIKKSKGTDVLQEKNLLFDLYGLQKTLQPSFFKEKFEF